MLNNDDTPRLTDAQLDGLLGVDVRAAHRSHIIGNALSQIKPNTTMSVCEWVEKNRVLPDTVKEPGKMRLDRTPYIKEILECLHPNHPAKTVIFKKGAQIAGSEAGYSFIGFSMHQAPGNIILALPTEKTFRTVSRERITPMIDNSPVLSEITTPINKRDGKSRVDRREFKGGTLQIVTVNSSASLKLSNARYLICDETDEYEPLPGAGDVIQLLRARTSTYGLTRKMLLTSTPGLEKNSRISPLYDKTDKRVYELPCPHCGEMHTLEWENFVYETNDPQSARMKCPGCGGEYDESHKTDMLLSGSWRATRETKDEENVGFALNSLYSPVGWKSWAEIAHEFELAKTDESLMQTFVNNVKGEPFSYYAYRPQLDFQTAQLVRYGGDGIELPNDVLMLTVGCDVQDNRVEGLVIGWGMGAKPYIIDKIKVMGDLKSVAFWEELETVLANLRYKRADGRMMKPAAVAIDTGGNHTTDVYAWIRGAKQRRHICKGRLYGIKGVPGEGRPLWQMSASVRSRATRYGVQIHSVGVDGAKTAIYQYIESGQMIFPVMFANGEYLDNEFFNQLLSEQKEKIVNRRGQVSYGWKVRYVRNEMLDCAVYAYALMRSMKVDWETLFDNVGANKPSELKVVNRKAEGLPTGNDESPPAPKQVNKEQPVKVNMKKKRKYKFVIKGANKQRRGR